MHKLVQKEDAEGWLYLRIDELAMVRVAAEVINTPLIDAVPDNDSAIDTDWVANIRTSYLDGQEVYCHTQPAKVALFFCRGNRYISSGQWVLSCMHVEINEILDHQLHLYHCA
jgi:hypothetical protein